MRRTSFSVKSLILAVSAVALILGSTIGLVLAGELDHEGSVTNVEQRAHAAELPATVVVRVKADHQSISVMHSNQLLPATANAPADSNFIPMELSGGMTGAAHSELDRDSSTDSWYFYFPHYNCYQPTYYYYGCTYSYQPYYNYYYGGYNYYYYWYRWW